MAADGSPHEETRTAMAGPPPELEAVRAYTLAVVEGPEAGKQFTVDGSESSPVLVGQSQVCDIRLSDRLVSRRHLSLAALPSGLRLHDLQSTNGTFVDGVRCFDAQLTGGEFIRLGSTAISVTAADASMQELPPARNFGRLVGASPAMRRLYPTCGRLARSDVSVVIEGETGTGKGGLAAAIHEARARRS